LLKKSIKRELRPAGLPGMSARPGSIYSQNGRLWKRASGARGHLDQVPSAAP
jgi:hypothetical protein